MKYLCTVKKFALPPATVKGAPGPFAAFLRLSPLFVSLHSRFHLFRAKDPLDPCIVGGDLPDKVE